MDILSIAVHEHGGKKVNAGFQNPQRPSWYLATQEAILPKAPFFSLICERLADRFGQSRQSLRIFEPGVGPGFFFEYLLTQSRLAERFELNLVGADVSSEMVFACQGLLRKIKPRLEWKPIRIALHRGIDLLELEDRALEGIVQAGTFDLVVASQFEHYFPNAPDSPLAERFRAEGRRPATKRGFRQFARERLSPGGFYVSVDDYLSGDPSQDEALTRLWDAGVVRSFSDPLYVARLREQFPKVAASLERRYNPALGLEVLLKKAAHARQRRRHRCYEETAQLGGSLEDLKRIFGPARVSMIQHPRLAHALFYLLCAERALKESES